MAEPTGPLASPTIDPDGVRGPAAVAHRVGRSPLALALGGSVILHLAVAAALFPRDAARPTLRPIIAVEFVRGEPGQNTREVKTALAAAPGAGAVTKPTPPAPKSAPPPAETKPVKKTPAKTHPVAKTTPPEPAPAKTSPKAAEPTPEKPKLLEQRAEATPSAPTAPPTPKATPPAPKAAAKTPTPKPAPPKAETALAPPAPKSAPTRPTNDAPIQTVLKPEPKAAPKKTHRTARIRTQPKPRTAARPKPVHERTARRTATKRPVRRPARDKQASRKQVASAPAGLYVPPRPGRGSGRNRPPVYPRRAQREGWQGRVLLFVEVTAKGTVSSLRIYRTSGYGILDRAAARAIRQWRFDPARRGGRAVAGWLVIPVRFQLNP